MKFRTMSFVGTLTCALFLSLVQQGQAAIISASDVIANWTSAGNLITTHGVTGSWFLSGSTVRGTSNHLDSLISDVSVSGNYSFSVNTQIPDNDGFGIVFGFQDAQNHYRLSWGQSNVDNGNYSTGGGSILRLFRRVGNTDTLLFSQSAGLSGGQVYNLGVMGTGTGFDITVENVTSSTTVASQSIADTTFTSGNVGIYDWFQQNGNIWTNFDITAGAVVPEPSTFAIWGLLSLGGIGACWRRRRKTT